MEVVAIVTVASVLCFGISAGYPCRSVAYLSTYNSTETCDVQLAALDVQTMFCDEETEYNDLASILWTPPNVALPLLYHRNKDIFTLPALGIFAVVYFLLSVLSSGLAVAGGLFIPMMLVGASMGRFVGVVLWMIFPSIDPSIYSLVGSAAVMTGFCRMTISLVVILVELTEGTQYLLPIILVVMVAKWVGDYFSHGIYERLIEVKGIPFLEGHAPKSFAVMSVTEFMEEQVVTFGEMEKVSTISQALCDTRHHGFPVVGDHGVFRGLILRSQLLVLLQRRRFVVDPANPQSAAQMEYPEFSDQLRRKLPNPKAIFLTEQEAEMFLDLRPYIDNSSITVRSSFSLGNAYTLFRTMGLRHLPVLNDENRVVGIITRKDFL